MVPNKVLQFGFAKCSWVKIVCHPDVSSFLDTKHFLVYFKRSASSLSGTIRSTIITFVDAMAFLCDKVAAFQLREVLASS